MGNGRNGRFPDIDRPLDRLSAGSSHSLREIPRRVGLRQGGRLDLPGLVTAQRPLEEVNEAMADMRGGRGIRTVLRVGG